MSRPTVGAIRWDAWTGGPVTEEVQRTLATEQYRFRLPWYAEVDRDSVRIHGGRQEIMDQEIAYAAHGGLDYWAFLLYADKTPMAAALELYLKSSRRGEVNFCCILHSSITVKDEAWPHELERLLWLLDEPGYQRVCNGRPLVYLFMDDFFGGVAPARVAEFRKTAAARGIDPYLAFMGWNPREDWKKAAPHGFSAVSAYAYAGKGKFSDVAAATERDFWRAALDASVPCIPLVTTGWDKRPRMDNPVSWERHHSYHKDRTFTERATPDEIAAHLSRGIEWVREHADACPAQSIIMYAWNENDEGGWLVPTWTENAADTLRIDAVRCVLRNLN
ncbi:MAG TPA: hypothetical protein VEJ63_08625 [Planctomycetota bacterium]|nr:hypothetical protein [Planctomycetota bacterium]